MTKSTDNMDLFGDLAGYEPIGASNDAAISHEPENAPEADSVAVPTKPKSKTKAAIKDELAQELRKLEAGNQDEIEAPDYATLDVAVAMEHRPRYVVRDDWTKAYGRPGVWFHGLKIGVESIVPIDTFICTPLHVLAITRDDNGRNFGRLLKLKDTLKRWKEWAMPMALLSGDGIELRAMLLDMGAEPDPDAKSSLLRYIQKQHPKREVLAATKLGWHGGGYLMPDRYFAPANDEIDAVLQDGALHASGLFERRGVLAAWTDSVAAYAPGNPLLTLTLSTAFAAPLRHRVPGVLNGGFHISGETSTGKTTVINAAASAWGNPEKGKQVGTWRATGNGLEASASMMNDNLMVLDEIGELSDPTELGNIIYFLGSGCGKGRMQKTTQARQRATFRLLFLSNGEMDKRSVLEAAKTKAQAGMDVRMVELAASRTYGAFDDLHGLSSGAALSNAINDACGKLFGVAGPAFLQNLIADTDLDADARHREIVRSFDAEPGAQGRVASLFALVALGGELATQYGLTGWQSGVATDAARLLFNEWRKHRPSGNQEAPAMLEAMRDFIDRHGGARFENRNHDDGNIIRDRAGWYEDSDKGRVYLFTSGGMKEALAGFDLRRGLDVLEAAGWLTGRDHANPIKGKVTKINGAPSRVFHVFVSDVENIRVTQVTRVTANGINDLSGYPSQVTVGNPGNHSDNDSDFAGEGYPVTQGYPKEVTGNILNKQQGYPVTQVTQENPDAEQIHAFDSAVGGDDCEVF